MRTDDGNAGPDSKLFGARIEDMKAYDNAKPWLRNLLAYAGCSFYTPQILDEALMEVLFNDAESVDRNLRRVSHSLYLKQHPGIDKFL